MTLVATGDPEPQPRHVPVTVSVSTGSASDGPYVIYNGPPNMQGPPSGNMNTYTSPPFAAPAVPIVDHQERMRELSRRSALPDHEFNPYSADDYLHIPAIGPDSFGCQDCQQDSFHRYERGSHLYVIRELGLP